MTPLERPRSLTLARILRLIASPGVAVEPPATHDGTLDDAVLAGAAVTDRYPEAA